jgi:acetyltransferase-like isoleucine patch superfamily enzyme
MLARVRFELVAWTTALARAVPGRLGCALRNRVLPYRNGSGVTVWEGVHIDRPSRLTLGDRVSINRGCTINAGGGIAIADDVLIGPGVVLYSQNHRYDDRGQAIREQGYELAAVTIEGNAWVAAGAVVLPGVTIGRGAVVGAGSVVTKDVAPDTLVAGNPARAIRSLKEGES